MAITSGIKALIWIVLGSIIVIIMYMLMLRPYQFGRPLQCVEQSGINFKSNLLSLAPFQKSLNRTQLRFYPSKYVSLRAVYIDDRPRDGHQSAVVFLANILKTITDKKLVVGCQVGDTKAVHFNVKVIGETPLWRAYPIYNKINHEEVLVDCFDVPAQDGDQALLYFKTNPESDIEIAVSERPVRKPFPYVSPTSPEGRKYNITVLTCTKVFGGNAPWFVQWLQYQKHIGIDHVHIDADNYFFVELSQDKLDYVHSEMKSGFLSIEPWAAWLANGKEMWYHNQGLILEDCGYRFRGSYDFMFVLDTDDFFVPRIAGEDKVHFYINKFFKPNTGSSKLRWVEYFPDVYLDRPKVANLTNGNITSLLTNFTHVLQGNPKSVHRTVSLVDTATHYAFQMTSGYQTGLVPIHDAYIAHVRIGRQPSFYKQQLVLTPP